MLWIPVTIVAALAQTGRNAAQAGLTKAIGTVGATQVRFLFGLPFACLFLLIVRFATAEPIPQPGGNAMGFVTLGALSQIGATGLMLYGMKMRSFALVTTWIKTEPVIVALTASLILGEGLTTPALTAIAIATTGVLIASWKPGAGQGLTNPGPILAGLGAAGLFGLSAIGFRGAIVELDTGGFLIRATTTLVISLTLQTAFLLVWMALFDRAALAGSFRVWKSSLVAGLLGAVASAFWFIGFSLTTAANVRTLALIEVALAAAVSWIFFRQRPTARQAGGMAVMAFGVALLLRAQAW